MRKTPKKFICEVCKNEFSNKSYYQIRRFCSPKCYHKSFGFLQMIMENGRKHKGMKHWWGEKIAQAKRGIARLDMRGEKNWNWKGGMDYGRRNEMQTLEYKQWRRKVFERDNYICRICGSKNGFGKTIYLIAHHIETWKNAPKLRYIIDNGMTICRKDHILGHKLLGY